MYNSFEKKKSNVSFYIFFILVGVIAYFALSHMSSVVTVLSDVKYVVMHLYGEAVERTLITIETYNINS